MKIGIAADHAGYAIKERLKLSLTAFGKVIDYGTDSVESVDYSDYAKILCAALKKDQIDRGILLCGTGIGMSIAANRFEGIRAALCHSAETARLARLHNDANLLILGARVLGASVILECIHTFFNTSFEGGRHADRIKKLDCLR